jgi:hypothetical protein
MDWRNRMQLRVWLNVVGSCDPAAFDEEYRTELAKAYEPTPEAPVPSEEWFAGEHLMRQVNGDMCEWIEVVDVEDAARSTDIYTPRQPVVTEGSI